MGYRNKTIGAAKGGLGCAKCSATAEKLLLTSPKMAKNARRNARGTLENAQGTLEKRSRYRPVLRLDVLNRQRWWCGQLTTGWGGGLARAWVCLLGVPKGKR